ncbi:hypothetical protein J6590_001553 [Homalodisca vitripennis]|nr:hypothetical protein J6590_001553 [Homalodisca vitripennis]
MSVAPEGLEGLGSCAEQRNVSVDARTNTFARCQPAVLLGAGVIPVQLYQRCGNDRFKKEERARTYRTGECGNMKPGDDGLRGSSRMVLPDLPVLYGQNRVTGLSSTAHVGNDPAKRQYTLLVLYRNTAPVCRTSSRTSSTPNKLICIVTLS